MERDLTVYIIQEGENPAMAFDTADLDAHDGIFAVSREEWEESSEFDNLVTATASALSRFPDSCRIIR